MPVHEVVPLTGADQQVVTGCGWITYIAVAETSGTTAARFDLFDGINNTGKNIGAFQMASGGDIITGLGKGRLGFRNSLFLHKVSGAFAGSIALLLCDTPQEWYALLQRYAESGE